MARLGALRRRITYANVMSTVAVFIALGGTSYAVARLPKDSVGTRQLRAQAVTTKAIASGAVTLDKLAADARIAGPRGPRGAQGPTGPTGPSDAWSAGTSSVELVRANAPAIVAQIAKVPAGQYVVQGHAMFVANKATRFEGRCEIDVDGKAVASSASFYGSDPDMVYAGPVSPLATITAKDPAILTLECRMNTAPPADNPVVQGGRLVALKVGDLN